MSSLQKSHRFESAKIKNSARGKECQIRYPGICNFDNSTTVLAHKNGGGAGTKCSDLMASYACSACHDEYDRRTRRVQSLEYVELGFYAGMARTQQILLDEGLVVLA